MFGWKHDGVVFDKPLKRFRAPFFGVALAIGLLFWKGHENDVFPATRFFLSCLTIRKSDLDRLNAEFGRVSSKKKQGPPIDFDLRD